jgi:hypothetical protein
VNAAHSQAVVHIVHSYCKILASIVSFYYGTDDSALVALFTELVLLPPVGEMLVVLPFSSLPVMIEVRLPSILSRTLAIKVSYVSAELLSPLLQHCRL